MNTKCAEYDVPESKLEYFWETEATGQSQAGQKGVRPIWSYAGTLANVTSPPTVQLAADAKSLNTTSLVSPEVYQEQWNVLTSVQTETTTENAFG